MTLHWLPFRFRCQYKLLLYAFKVFHGIAPLYLNELIRFYKLARSWRYENAALIEMSKQSTDQHVWYMEVRLELPSKKSSKEQSLELKKGLKTHLFKVVFVDCFYLRHDT